MEHKTISDEVDFKKLAREEKDILEAKQMGAVIVDKKLFRKYHYDILLNDVTSIITFFLLGMILMVGIILNHIYR